MKINVILLCSIMSIVRVCNVEAAILGHFEAAGNHVENTEDHVSVDFKIMGVLHPRELALGQSYAASYTAIYTTTSGDPGFNTTDIFNGTGTVVDVEIGNDDSYIVKIEFPQNPLPNAWDPPKSSIQFIQSPAEALTGGWTVVWIASPYTFSSQGPLEYQSYEGGGVEIISFSRNGNITWTSRTGEVCTIEWAAGLTPQAWKNSWEDLDEIRTTQEIMTARVPMFYRVLSHTNGYLQPMRVGTELTYTASNSLGHIWTLTETVCGTLRFPDPSLMPGCTNKYYMVRRSETWEAPAPEGIGFLWNDAPYSYVCSTTNSLFEWQGSFQRRALHEAEPGVVWTNQFRNFKDIGEITIACSVAGTEVITVPAGTFECTRCDLTVVGIPGMTCTDWIRHDLGLVKRVSVIPDLIGDASPVTYQLETIKR